MKASGSVFLRDATRMDYASIRKWENNPEVWAVSERSEPYTKSEIEALMASSDDYHVTQQKRWMIVDSKSFRLLGAVDIFKGNCQDGETNLGILIAEAVDRNKGYGAEAIGQAIKKAVDELSIHTFHALVHNTNRNSIRLFEKCGFENVGSDEDNSTFGSAKVALIRFRLCLKK